MRADEHRLQNALLVELSKLDGCLTWRNTVGTFRAYGNPDQIVKVGVPGQADVFACYRGRFFSLELKSSRGRVGPKQKAWCKAVERCGGTHLWVILSGSEDEDIEAAIQEAVLSMTKDGPREDETHGARGLRDGATQRRNEE